MTKEQAAALQRRWEQRAYNIPCEHLTLELERNGEGHATGKYICILCGESVAERKKLAA